ncbi:MAG: hypothetical protein GAK35_02209 [Herbaspirillum frisingense]|uniref:Transglycosylase SLT domain-containing protein n=1 Tax=Herbaspirillum frisingense TaxID=92645 RepID=A0A7V8FWM1_9BURK|nr:MAG: hypothetical protein GAK35_02209 [Herbaspirillum frisingense]
MPQPTQDQLTATYSNDQALGLPQGTTARQLGVESSFNPNAVSPKGAQGYAQVMPKTLATLSERAGRQLDPTNFEDSLYIHREVMGENMKHFGNLPDALRAYNSGWDASKWDNTETNNYVQKITGADAVTKKLMLSQSGAGLRNQILAQQAGDRTELDRMQQYGDMSLVDAGTAQSGAELAAQTHYAGFGESMYQTFQWDTVTGRIADLFRQEAPEEGFQASPEMVQNMAQNAPLVYRNDDLRSYVQGADSTREWDRRMQWATERADFQQRAANTKGWRAGANGVGSLVAGFADPVTLLATWGAGSVVAAARGAYVSAEAASSLRAYAGAAAGGALGNMAVSAAVTKLSNQEVHWPEMFQQGLTGAVLGGAGHWVGNRFNVNRGATRGAELTDHEVIQRNIDEAGAQPPGNRGPGTFNSDVSDTPAYGPTGGLQAPAVELPLSRMDESARVGYHVEPTIADPRYRELHGSGVVTELRSAEDVRKVSNFQARAGEDIPATAKAFYSPQEDRVYVFSDRLSAADRADPTGLLMHEVGVHYGLERTIGTERYNQLAQAITESTDRRVQEALARVPEGTNPAARVEETLGYLAEHNPKLSAFQNAVSYVRNWLRESVPAFDRMRITTNDALRYIQGSLENVRKNGTLSEVNAATGQNLYSVEPIRDSLRLGPRADAFKAQMDNWQEVLPEETAQLRNRASNWYEFTKQLPVYKQFRQMFDSVGLKLGQSKSKGVRMWASRLGEDATGANRQHATSAAIDKERLQAGWRTAVLEAWHRLLPQMVSDEEKAILSQGPLGGAVEKRVGKMIAREREAHRKAVQAGQQYTSQASPAVRQMAGVLDSMFKDIGETGERFGDVGASNIKKLGYVGYMPYKFDWEYIHKMYNENPAEFNGFKAMIRQSYTEDLMQPAIDAMLKAGPVPTSELEALRVATVTRIEHLTDNYISQVIRDPKSRIDGAEEVWANMAADILREHWEGQNIGSQVAENFRKHLADRINDRERREFDLNRQDANGRSMMDYLDTDVGRMVSNATSKYAGTVALAKAGLRDATDRIALKDALRNDGAAPEEIDNIDFLMRSLADELGNKEMGAAKLLRQAAHFSMMGGLGFNAVADLGSVAATVGVKGFMKSLAGARLNPDSPLIRELNRTMPSVMGMDHRFHIYDTTASRVQPDNLLAQGTTFNRVMDAGGQMVNTLSGMKHVNQMAHNGYLPVMLEDMLDAIHGKDGGLTPARLADTGLFGETVTKIKAELDKHAPNRKRGDDINLDNWDDQSVADDFKNAVHRAAGQSLQRSFVGETPRWMSEGVVGSVMSQFKRFGITAAEKQAARNAFIGDANAVTGMAFATAWGAALYYAKTLAKTVGMDETQREKYMQENMSGVKLATGVMVMVNMSGLLPDAADLTQTLMGGGSHASGSPVAALGALQNITKGIGAVSHAAGSAVGLVDKPDYVRDFKTAWKVVPGSNTIFGAALVNSLSAP